MGDLPHLDEVGDARMVDVGSKPSTERVAEAENKIHLDAATQAALFGGDLPKGDALAVARVAANA